jgi:hypothetical protein
MMKMKENKRIKRDDAQVRDKNEINSDVENTFIPYFSNFFNLFSLDQNPISCPLPLKDRDSATYGTSFKCEDNISSAIDKEPSNKSFGTISYLTRPYLFAIFSFTSLPNLKQSSSDSLLFSVILLNTDSSNFLNAFDFSNFNSTNLSSIASKANLDLSAGNSSISFSNSSGIFNLNSAISIASKSNYPHGYKKIFRKIDVPQKERNVVQVHEGAEIGNVVQVHEGAEIGKKREEKVLLVKLFF